MPLDGNDDEEFLKRRNAYYELATRDFIALSMTEKIMRPTRYTLAPDTALALCLMYGSTMRIAPGLYGKEARITAMRKQRSICLIMLGIFLFACFFGTVGSMMWGWIVLLSLMGFMLGGMGWYADSCLLHMACEAERLLKTQKTL